MGNVRLTRGAKVAATASEADRRAGDAGPQAGPREPSGWLAAALGGAGRWLAGPVAGRAGWAEQLAGRPSSLLPFLFFISFPFV